MGRKSHSGVGTFGVGGRDGLFALVLAIFLHGFAAYLLLTRYFVSFDQVTSSYKEYRKLHEGSAIFSSALKGASEVRVYVYNLPPKYNRLQVEKSHEKPSPVRDPFCDTNFYSAEVKVHHGLLRSASRTFKPEEADYFYVPIYVTCFLLNNHPNNLTRTGRFYNEAISYIKHKYPYWNRSQGRDHVHTFTQGFGARLAGENWPKIRNGVFLTHNGDFKSEAAEYIPRKDIVIPPALDHYLTPAFVSSISKSHTNNSRGVTAPSNNIDRDIDSSRILSKRTHLAMFGGQAFSSSIKDHRGANYSGGVRQYLTKHAPEMPGFYISGVRSGDYLWHMKNSLFTLAPEGWHPWSPRPYYGILLASVPVVLSDRQELAFEDVIPYDKLAVFVRPQDVHGLNSILRSIPVEECLEKIEIQESIWQLYWYGRDGRAIDAILAALNRHKYAVHPQRDYRVKAKRVTLQ